MIRFPRRRVSTHYSLSLEEEAFIRLVSSSRRLWQMLSKLLRDQELTPTQYNALRILREEHPGGLGLYELGDRLVTLEADVTRLARCLVERGLVDKKRSQEDRRVTEVFLAEPAFDLLAELDAPVDALLHDTLGKLSDTGLEKLIGLLKTIR